MAISASVGGDFEPGGGQFLEVAGWYHFVIDDVEENPTKGNGELVQNAMCKLNCVVAQGPEGTEEKRWGYTMKHPKEPGDFFQKKNDRTWIALGVLNGTDDEKGGAVNVEPADLKGRQFIAEIELDEYKGKLYGQLRYSNIFHVDDPAVAHVKKNSNMLSLIPPHLRRTAKKPAPAPASTGLGDI